GDLGQGGAVVLGDGRFGAGDQLQHAAPPRQLQLRSDLVGADPAQAQVLDQLAQPIQLQAAQQLGAARQGRQVLTVTVQRLQALLELVEFGADQVRSSGCAHVATIKSAD